MIWTLKLLSTILFLQHGLGEVRHGIHRSNSPKNLEIWHICSLKAKCWPPEYCFHMVWLKDLIFFSFQHHILCFCSFRDPYHTIAAINPEKLNIFQTVREITGNMLLISYNLNFSLCIYGCYLLGFLKNARWFFFSLNSSCCKFDNSLIHNFSINWYSQVVVLYSWIQNAHYVWEPENQDVTVGCARGLGAVIAKWDKCWTRGGAPSEENGAEMWENILFTWKKVKFEICLGKKIQTSHFVFAATSVLTEDVGAN